MAKVKGNAVTGGITGMVGEQIVFKTRLGTRYACAPPTVNENRKPSARQQAAREKMSKCSAYAVRAIKDPELKQRYQAAATGGQTAVNVAVHDAWHAPVVKSVVTGAYKGEAGDPIFVQATDNFGVVAVTVAIFDKEGLLIEEGNATSNAGDVLWTYIATVSTDSYRTIVAKAYDLPHNETQFEVTV